MYEELVKVLRGCVDCLCGECPYEDEETKRGNFVPCMNKLISKAADALQENSQRWIPVSEQLPPIDEDVLVFAYGSDTLVWSLIRPYNSLADTFWDTGRYYEYVSCVIHWMPLPNKPKDGGKNG